jgi:hypothetical protein
MGITFAELKKLGILSVPLIEKKYEKGLLRLTASRVSIPRQGNVKSGRPSWKVRISSPPIL